MTAPSILINVVDGSSVLCVVHCCDKLITTVRSFCSCHFAECLFCCFYDVYSENFALKCYSEVTSILHTGP